MEYEVTWTATFKTKIQLEPGENLADSIADLNIPEGEDTTYVVDTFDVESVEDEEGNDVTDQSRDIVG